MSPGHGVLLGVAYNTILLVLSVSWCHGGAMSPGYGILHGVNTILLVFSVVEP